MTKARSSERRQHTEFFCTALCTAFGAVWLGSPLVFAVATYFIR